MKKVIALGGSNSRKSINQALAKYAADRIDNTETVVVDLSDYDLPLYGIDTERENGIPDDAVRLNSMIDSADGLVISLAEHNGSYSVAFKNAFDWLSRIDKNVWKNKPMLLMATSPGGRGGATVLATAKNTFPRLGGNIVADFSLPKFNDNFSENGLNDDDLNRNLNHKIALLSEAIKVDLA